MTASKAGETPTLAENVHRAFTECNHLRIENAELLNSIEALQAKLSAAELDAGRFNALQNMPPLQAQAFFWHHQSRKQRAKAIDEAIAALRRCAP